MRHHQIHNFPFKLNNDFHKNVFKFGQVKERAIPINELIEADEVFCTGTAVGVAPVGSITYQDKR